MSLKTYDFKEPFVLRDGCGDPNCDRLEPGSRITHRVFGGDGMVIAIERSAVTVLWAREPTSFNFPHVARQVNHKAIAKQIVKVQPMTAPAGAVFYLDYTYGEKPTRLDRVKSWLSHPWRLAVATSFLFLAGLAAGWLETWARRH